MVNNGLKVKTSLVLCLFSCLSIWVSQAHAHGFYDNFNDLNITNQSNQPFSTDELNNKISLFNFIYTNCSATCAVQTHQLSKLYQQLAPELKHHIRFVSVSLDPVKDDPVKLKQFANTHKADWDFLALDYLSLVKLRERLVLFKEDYGKTLYEAIEHVKAGTNNNQYKLEEHTATLWLIGPKGLVRQKYPGNPVDIKRVSAELAALHRVEFERNKIKAVGK